MDEEKISLRTRISRDIHRRLKIASANRNKTIEALVGEGVSKILEEVEENELKQEIAKFITALLTGIPPNDGECAVIAHDLGLSTEQILELRDRTITKLKNGSAH